MSKKLYKFEVLRTGEFKDANGRDVKITLDHLNELADNYDPVNSPSPLVLGHPKDNGPAHGWADSFKVVGNKLIATATKIHESLVDAVKKGLYKKISLSIFDPDSPANPVQGSHYVRHVGLLGSMAPAVPGIKPLNFNENEKGVFCLEFSAQKTLTQQIREIIFDMLPDHADRSSDLNEQQTNEDNKMPESKGENDELKKIKADLAAEKAKNKTLETKLKSKDQETAKEEVASFCEKLINDGKLAPALKGDAIDLMNELTSHSINLSEDTKNPLKMFQDFLVKQDKILDFKEKSKPDEDPNNPINFSAPPGVKVGKTNIELHNKVSAYMQKNGCTYDEALDAFGV